MKVGKINTRNITLRPTYRKVEKGKRILESFGVLPKEAPVEKKVYVESSADTFERVKESIQLSIDNMKRQ